MRLGVLKWTPRIFMIIESSELSTSLLTQLTAKFWTITRNGDCINYIPTLIIRLIKLLLTWCNENSGGLWKGSKSFEESSLSLTSLLKKCGGKLCLHSSISIKCNFGIILYLKIS